MSISSYNQGLFNPSQSAVIANGAQSSAAINCSGMTLVGFMMPAAFTGTALTFEVCDTLDGTYLPLYDSANALVSMTVAASRAYVTNPLLFQGVQFLKIKSGSAEGAARTIVCQLKGL